MALRGTSKADVVEYRGHRYRRYPKSRHAHHRKYYYATEPRRGFLHRHIWEDENGPIPEGYDIHHINEDTTDNRIENLECLPASKHRSMHLSERSKTPEHLARLDAIRPLASAWHQSDEGRAWHSKMVRETWHKRKRYSLNCIECGKGFQTVFKDRAKFCSSACAQRYRTHALNPGMRRKDEPWTGKCEQCGGEFKSIGTTTKYCSSKCRERARYQRRKATRDKAGVQPDG